MSREDYIKKCGAKNAKGLSADQILDYFIAGHGGLDNKFSALTIRGGAFGMKPDRAKGIAMLRKAFEEDKVLRITFVDGEGVVTDENSIGTSHFQMVLSKG